MCATEARQANRTNFLCFLDDDSIVPILPGPLATFMLLQNTLESRHGIQVLLRRREGAPQGEIQVKDENRGTKIENNLI